MLLALLGLTVTAQAGCDRAEVAKILEAIPQIDADQRGPMVGEGLSMACPTPAGLARGAADLARVPPDRRFLIDMKVAAETPMEWMAVCTGGLGALADMAALAPSAKRAHLWGACDLGRLGWLSQAEWQEADGSIVIALVGGYTLGKAGVPEADVSTLVRALAGVRDGAPAPSRHDDLMREGELLLQLIGSTDDSEAGIITNLWSDDGLGLGGIDAALATGADGKPRFADGGRATPRWSRGAQRAGGECTVDVRVTAGGTLRDLEFVACARALQDDVRAAIEASTLEARVRDGVSAPGRFRTVYQVQ